MPLLELTSQIRYQCLIDFQVHDTAQDDRPSFRIFLIQIKFKSFQPHIIDVAICWNYLVVADSEGIVKYGLANGKHGQCRLPLPPGATKVRQISATPRHLLVVTEIGGK